MNASGSPRDHEQKPVKAPCIPDPGSTSARDALEKCVDPCALVIFGATGDLTARKLMPALFNLYLMERLPHPFLIVGCGRAAMGDDRFRNETAKALKDSGISDSKGLADFLSFLHYRTTQYDGGTSFDDFAGSLRELEKVAGTGGNRIFYLALPPKLYLPTARMIGQADLASERRSGNGWVRLVVEKPFGRDRASAVELDRGIHEYLFEHQIFRIDHYLAKETVQNVLMFRFANAVFEPVWNRRYIDCIRISATETLGVEHRAGYYEEAGVIRDMFQNHMMQLLALTAMEPPSVFEADRVRDEKVKVYRALKPFQTDSLDDYLVLGQYGRGTIAGQAVPAYRDEAGVSPDSLTPTYAMMKVYLDNWRWQGVPFYLVSGKRLHEKRTEIAIDFKPVPHSMFRNILGETVIANRLVLGVYPEERIMLTFQTKTPGARVNLRTVTMDFHYHQNPSEQPLEAYEKVLLDCLLGDQILFWRQDGVETCWAFLTPILSACENCSDRSARLHLYPSGSSGPQPIDGLKLPVETG